MGWANELLCLNGMVGYLERQKERETALNVCTNNMVISDHLGHALLCPTGSPFGKVIKKGKVFFLGITFTSKYRHIYKAT